MNQSGSQFLPSMSLLLILVTITSFQAPISVFGQEDKYQNCSTSFQCGNITEIGYPFWGSSRPSYCGHPDFQLTCSGQTATISISELTYRVLQLDTTSRTLTLARTDYLTSICPDYLYGTNINANLFSYPSGILNVTIFYLCSSRVPGNYATVLGLSSLITCTINTTTVSSGYYTVGNLTVDLGVAMATPIYAVLETCSYSVIIPANQSIAQSSLNVIQPTEDTLVEVLDQGFGLFWDADGTDETCSTCISKGGACGYNQSNNSFACYCPEQGCKSGKQVGAKFAIGFSTGGIILVCVLLGCCFLVHRKIRKVRKAKQNEEVIKTLMMGYQSLMPKEYSYSEIKKMTNAFANKLGQGGFGGVYKGQLLSGQLVAVKVLHKSESEAEEFINEVASIGRTSHVNVVTLLGYCLDKKKALVYQYMPKGSLDKFIYQQQQDSERMECHLGWNVSYDIALGIARGLDYLHRGCSTRIVHLDIKPHNILLDEDFCPKIADFGLAKLCKGKESKVSMLGARGTVGYIAPEVFIRSFGQVSHKADVYSYGMMILEMVGGRKNFDNGFSHTSEKYFPDWIYQQLEQVEVSKFSRGITSDEEEIARKMALVGLWCIQTNPSDRPSMTKVIEMLEGSPRSLQIPPKPYLHSPARSPYQYSSTTSVEPYASSQKCEEDAPLQVVELQPA